MFTPEESGKLSLNITINYTDDFNQPRTIIRTLEIEVTEGLKEGYSQVIVKVQDVDQVLEISDQITKMSFQAFTPQFFVQGINNFYVILQFIFGGVGAIALLVAAIGIANTMAMPILERRREIGLMKAVGATNRDVLAIFLGEAVGIGGLGGVIGWQARVSM